MITRIKRVEWYNPKTRQDAVSWKVWVESNGQVTLSYFDSEEELTAFQKSLEPKIKKAKRRDKPLD